MFILQIHVAEDLAASALGFVAGLGVASYLGLAKIRRNVHSIVSETKWENEQHLSSDG